LLNGKIFTRARDIENSGTPADSPEIVFKTSKGSEMDGALHIIDSDGWLNVFNLNRDKGGLWLDNDNGNPGNVWNPDNRFLFVRPRKSLYFSVFLTEFLFC
jgi:hypothetical protein